MRKFNLLISLLFLPVICGCGGDAEVTNQPAREIYADEIETSRIMNAYADVLRSNTVFYTYTNFHNGYFNKADELGHQGEYTLLNDLLDDVSDDEYTWQIGSFAVVDMDGGGIPEIVTELNYAGERIVFHYENGEIYGYTYGLRGMNRLKKDGVFVSSGGAATVYFQKLQFTDGICKNIVLAYCDTADENGERYSVYYINDKRAFEEMFLSFGDEHNKKEDVEWYTYTEDTVDKILLSYGS